MKMVTVYHGTRGGIGGPDAGPNAAIRETGILKKPVYVSTDPLVARYFGAYVWKLRVPREWLKVDTYLENYPDIEEETGRSVDFFRGKIFFIDRDLPVRRASWSDMRNVPRNPFSPTMSQQERQLMIDRGKELMWVIGEYEALARAGRAYPDHRVNRLFNILRVQYLGNYQHYWECGLDFNGTRSIGEMFQDATTRVDKVIAIDALMHLQHKTGHVLTAIYDFFTTGIPDKEITEMAKNAEREINRVLTRLAVNPRRNPSITKQHFNITRYDDGAMDFDYIGGIKGLATLRGVVEKNGVAKIAFFSIDHESQKQGLGRAWVDAVEKFLRKEGATLIWAGSLPSAVGFWRKMGYTIGEKSSGVYRITKRLSTGNPLYHGGRDQGPTGTLKFGHYGRVNSGCDSGAIFVTPSQKYARQYVQSGGRLYEADVDLKKERIFDATNTVHLRKLERLTNRETIRAITETISHGAGDWATMSQFLEEIQEAGFTGVKFLERPGENIEELPGGGFSVSGPPVYSYGFFHEVPVRAVAK